MNAIVDGNDTSAGPFMRLRAMACRTAMLGLLAFGGVAAAASLQGVVFEDLDDDGVHDTGEAPIAGATVNLRYINDATVQPAVLTDALGQFSFSGLAAGTYELTSVSIDGYYDGKTTPGSAGGESVTGPFAENIYFINLQDETAGTGYLFAKVPHAAAPMTADLYVYLLLTGGTTHPAGMPVDAYLFVANQGYRTLPARVSLSLPAGVSIESFEPDQGTFDAVTGIWTIDSFGGSSMAGVPFKLRATGTGSTTVDALVEITDPAITDPEPGNDTSSVTFEIE